MITEDNVMTADKIRLMIARHEAERAAINAALAQSRKPDVTVGQALKFAAVLAFQSLWSKRR
jgi:hypothetical protein